MREWRRKEGKERSEGWGIKNEERLCKVEGQH